MIYVRHRSLVHLTLKCWNPFAGILKFLLSRGIENTSWSKNWQQWSPSVPVRRVKVVEPITKRLRKKYGEQRIRVNVIDFSRYKRVWWNSSSNSIAIHLVRKCFILPRGGILRARDLTSWFVTNICLWRAQGKYGRVTASCRTFHFACVELELDCSQMF